MLIEKDKSSLLIVDVQEKLVSVMPKPHTFIDKITKLQKAANILGVPIILSEQYPKGLGKTIDKIKANMGVNNTIIEKTEFSVQIKKISSPKHFIICGIEAHVCVLQTAINLIDDNTTIYIVGDAVSSRYENDYLTALSRMEKYQNIEIVSFEMVLFEWLRNSNTKEFKDISKLIK